jgi:hypothetical protein
LAKKSKICWLLIPRIIKNNPQYAHLFNDTWLSTTLIQRGNSWLADLTAIRIDR